MNNTLEDAVAASSAEAPADQMLGAYIPEPVLNGSKAIGLYIKGKNLICGTKETSY